MTDGEDNRRRFAPRRGAQPNVLALVLAGGEGQRLAPLTIERAKPAVPIGGRYRLIDFVLSNLVNSGFLKIKVLVQYKSDSLSTHIARGWRLPAMLDLYVEVVPAQQRRGKDWFRGSADAIFQSINVITDESPDYVCVFSADHIYKMDVRQMLDYHLEMDAHMTVAAVPVPVAEATQFGVLEVDEKGWMIGFREKAADPREMPNRPGWALASCGNYIWNTDALIDEARQDAESASQHDFGKNVIPRMVGNARVAVYDISQNMVPGQPERERGYWRDVGTIRSYFDANMDLVQVEPLLDLYNPRWPIRTWTQPSPPAKFVFADEGSARVGQATDSLVSEGCIISGGRVNRSVLSPNVRVNSFAQVEESILFEGVSVGRHARVVRAIVDKGVKIPSGAHIGVDHALDLSRGFRWDETDGITVVPKGFVFT